MSADRIEKKIVLRAPRSRVWRAIADAEEFGTWFRLAEVPGGTELTVVESGFDRIPLARRDEAFRMNEGGWTAQLKNVEAHVAS